MHEVKLAHPSPDQLAALDQGRLDEAEAAAVADHLANCPSCRALLEALPEDAFVEKLRQSARSEPATTTPAEVVEASEAPTRTDFTPGALNPGDIPPGLVDHPRYLLQEVLGTGGMGTVYRAEHRLMERPVALKVVRPDWTGNRAAVERFRREVKSAARLDHPNIVRAYDAEQAGETHFLVMEFVPGTSLDRLLKEQGALPVALACDYARQTALGLQHAFERGMVHRDIKPANLMRTPEGRIKILDFGLARFAQETTPAEVSAPAAATLTPASPLTRIGTVLGTPDYLAPEQAANQHAVDIRADIYSLGCTLYHLLTGQVPFPEGTTLDKVLAHTERAPRPITELRGDVPAELAGVVERLLAKVPARRYQTPAEVAQALAPFTVPVPQPDPAPPPGGRRRGLTVALGGFGAAGGLLALLLLGSREQENMLGEYLNMLYLICAVVGGTILGCQFLLGLLGFGEHHTIASIDPHTLGDHGFHHGGDQHGAGEDAATSWFLHLLTFRTLVAALTFFGLAGRAAAASQLDPVRTLILAVAAGGGALFLVAGMMRSLHRLRADGTLRMERAVGKMGTVYLPVPGQRAGVGKVHLNLQNRTVECQAITRQDSLPTGAKVTVVAVVSPDTVEVIPALKEL